MWLKFDRAVLFIDTYQSIVLITFRLAIFSFLGIDSSLYRPSTV